MASHKLEYDRALIHKEYRKVNAHVVEFSELPPVMCSGGIFTEHTFGGA